MDKLRLIISTILCLLISGGVFLHAESDRVGHVRAELTAESPAIYPGQSFLISLKLKVDDGWHIYWRNPGDAGAPPSIDWKLPPGFSTGEIMWPYPERILLPPLTNFGYEGEVSLLSEITAPLDLKPGDKITLNAIADWLVCKEVCIPERADLNLTLNIADGKTIPNSPHPEDFTNAKALLPIPAGDWNISGEYNDTVIIFTLTAPDWFDGRLSTVDFFPYNRGVVANSLIPTLTREGQSYQLSISRDMRVHYLPDKLNGILTTPSGWRGPDSEKAMEISVEMKPVNFVADTEGVSNLGIALLFAFLGGLILNLMPCVLPVLSLKIFSIINQANQSRRTSVVHGFIFSLGVIVSFWILAGGLLILQAGGQSLGWGFQLQSPAFLVILSSFLFLFALSLLGVFEIGQTIPGRLAQTTREGYPGSFLNGVMATILATPCTAPFMGSALGYSLSQPPVISLLIFTFLGIGMAMPFVILSAFPGLLRFLPKPGQWMETLKHIMGFLLMGTILWLAWVLSLQAGADAVIMLLAALLLLSFGAWLRGRWGNLALGRIKRLTSAAAFAFLITLGLTVGLYGIDRTERRPDTSDSIIGQGIKWESYSPDRLSELRQSGRIIFVDFTAAWCLSCQVNERVAFGSDEVQNKFAELNVAAIKADWTSRDENITRALAAHGRNSVPLYILYYPGVATPVILPEILTPGIVLKELNSIANKPSTM